MNVILRRKLYHSTGIISSLELDSGGSYTTLEHAYPSPLNGYLPKLGSGTYTCVRGMHTLTHVTTPFQTFEVTNVPRHTGILFHVGNYNDDSDGCILVGDNIRTVTAVTSVTNSVKSFKEFMDSLDGVNEFQLTVID